MKKNSPLLLIAVILLAPAAFAQRISGRVNGSMNKPLEGVTIQAKPAMKNTVTDSGGAFSLAATGRTQLHFSCTGYREKDTIVNVTTSIVLVITLEEEAENLDEVVIVSSSRTHSRIEDLPTKVEVLGAEEVHEENGIKPGNIASLLGDIAGIQIQQTNAATGNAEMRVQGLQGKYTQLLRDGMPLFGGYSGSFSILQIPPLDLQQIELVKGAASTLYGGGAIAGMVNLVSRKPKLHSPERSFTLNRSSLLENNANFFFSSRNENTGYTLFTGGTLQDPVDVNKDGFSDLPSVKNVFIHPRFFVYNGKKSNLVLGYTFNYEDRKGGDMEVLKGWTSPTHQFFIRNTSNRHTADLVWERNTGEQSQLTVKASTSFFNRRVETQLFGMAAAQFAWFSEMAYAHKSDHHNWVIGINFNGDQLRKKQPDSTAIPDEQNNTIGFFAQDDWKWNDHFTLQTGMRIDATNRYGMFLLPRLSLMYRISKALTTRLGGGLGYKTPVLFNSEVDERDYRYLAGYRAGISPERSLGMNYDINYKHRVGSWALTFNQTFFYNQVQHAMLLTGTPGWGPLLYYTNAGEPLQTMGSESYVQATHEELELYLGYVYTDAKRKYDPEHPHLPLIAKHKLATVIAYEFNTHFRAGIESSYTGKQWLNDGSTTTPYLFTAVMMRYNLGKAAFVLNCENLFDYRQSKEGAVVFPPYTNPVFPEIWAPLDGRVVNLSMFVKW